MIHFCIKKKKKGSMTRYDETDHAPALKTTMLMCTTKQGLMTSQRRGGGGAGSILPRAPVSPGTRTLMPPPLPTHQ